MKDLLIIGGFNWLGYELTNFFIQINAFSNIIIVDILNNFLLKDNKTKSSFDNYAHLYDENIFLYNINIKDKNRLENIYQKHNIKYVINNIKFNCNVSDLDKMSILHGFVNIVNLNTIYKIDKYVYLTRTYTHEKIMFHRHKQDNFLEENFIFNESTFLVNENKGILINIPDYIFGDKCYNSSNFFSKLVNIINVKSPLYIPQCSVICFYDELLLTLIIESLFSDISDSYINDLVNKNISGPHHYVDIFNYFKNTTRNTMIIEKAEQNTHPGMMSKEITNDSLLGIYLSSLD